VPAKTFKGKKKQINTETGFNFVSFYRDIFAMFLKFTQIVETRYFQLHSFSPINYKCSLSAPSRAIQFAMLRDSKLPLSGAGRKNQKQQNEFLIKFFLPSDMKIFCFASS
jgi:hypothetical protein